MDLLISQFNWNTREIHSSELLNSNNEKYASVWLTGALRVKSLLLNAKGDVKGALALSRTAHKIATKDNRVFRVYQLRELINFLENEVNKKN